MRWSFSFALACYLAMSAFAPIGEWALKWNDFHWIRDWLFMRCCDKIPWNIHLLFVRTCGHRNCRAVGWKIDWNASLVHRIKSFGTNFFRGSLLHGLYQALVGILNGKFHKKHRTFTAKQIRSSSSVWPNYKSPPTALVPRLLHFEKTSSRQWWN